MSFELSIACRYLLTRSQHGLRISPISLISMIGIGIGVMAVIVALALMTGLQGELRDRILGATAHVYVWKVGGLDDYGAEVERLRGVDGVTGAAPAILGRGMISTGQADAVIALKGIDPALEASVTDIGTTMLRGSVEALAAQSPDDLPGILIGRNLADTLGVDVGDTAQLLTQQGTLTPFGILPRPRPVRVVGIFALGLYEFDAAYAFISLEFSGRVLGKATPDLIELRVADLDDAPAVKDRVVEALGASYTSQDWTDMNQSLFSALWIEKVAISLTVGLIVMVAALNIIASLILLVIEKGRDIGILKTMGTSSAQVTRIFMLQGVIIGLVGTTIGATVAVSLCWVLDRYRLISIPMDVYQVSYVPFVVLPLDFVIVVGTAILICFLATLYPSRQASRLDPVQALRFE